MVNAIYARIAWWAHRNFGRPKDFFACGCPGCCQKHQVVRACEELVACDVTDLGLARLARAIRGGETP